MELDHASFTMASMSPSAASYMQEHYQAVLLTVVSMLHENRLPGSHICVIAALFDTKLCVSMRMWVAPALAASIVAMCYCTGYYGSCQS